MKPSEKFLSRTRKQDDAKGAPNQPLLEHKRMGEDQSIGYVRINNSLGSIELIRNSMRPSVSSRTLQG